MDADGVGGPRVLADRPDPQPPAGAEQRDVDDDEQDGGAVDEHVLVEQHRAEDRDLRQPGSAIGSNVFGLFRVAWSGVSTWAVR